MCIPFFGCIGRSPQTVRLHFLCRKPEQAGHLSRMWRNHQKVRVSVSQGIALTSERVQPVGVQYHGSVGALHDRANDLLRFRMLAETRTDSKNGFALFDLLEAEF